MTENDLHALATMLTQQQSILSNYKYFVVLCLLSFVGSAIAYFCASYLAERGKNFATKTDFENLLDQLKLNTKAVARIQADIAHYDCL